MSAGGLALALLAALAAAQHEQQVARWATCLGDALHELSAAAARRREAEVGFKTARVLPVRGPELLGSVAQEIERFMRMKVAAVREIVERAEYEWRQSDYEERTWPLFDFRDAKRINITNFFKDDVIDLKENGHFFGAKVNTSYSAVQVPTHLYEGDPKILRGIEWSKGLDEVFRVNYKNDPSLYWQYFGSASGFMRRYPASAWEPNPKVEPDIFDCRTRAWYIEAATSPKDVLILVDNSGSMTGQKRELARRVVFEILDTLGSNDFLNIISFNNTLREVVCCFKNRLVQANLANIRSFKMGMEGLEKASNTSEYKDVLEEAFNLLQNYRVEQKGSNCNQAIMLITDGSPETFEEIFELWNWNQNPRTPVRVFTYLIGAEADLRELRWMACANRGWFSHVSKNAEVREHVMKYVSVMARPLVLNQTHHPAVWATAYADIIDPKMTDYLWNEKEDEIQKGISWYLRKSRVYKIWKAGGFKEKKKPDKNLTQIVELAIKQEEIKDDRSYLVDTTIKRYPYKMMTAVSMPVYDTRHNYTDEANILGVAGTDIPNFDIQRLMIPHALGVNGYAFIVTNNGYTYIHPELRPDFQVIINGEITSILKPNYNNIDFMDVELPLTSFSDDEIIEKTFRKNFTEEHGKTCFKDEEKRITKPRLPKPKYPCRQDDPDLLRLREDLINGVWNGSTSLVTIHQYDGLRRVSYGKKHYFYTPINGTPFELVIVLPDGYGLQKIETKPEIITKQNPRRNRFEGRSTSDLFKDRSWRIHPNWYYCKYHSRDTLAFNTPEEELLHFLNRTMQPGWKWPKARRNTPDHYHCHICETFKEETEKQNFYCDKTLLLSLWHDAKATDWIVEPLPPDVKQKLGLVLVFVATRSGLTRWQDIVEDLRYYCEDHHFSELHNRAIDETWYKRAVERYYVEPEDFVYSVPFKAGDMGGTLVTVSQAVFLTNGTSAAPAAVVGLQFKHAALYSLFTEITFQSSVKGVKSCDSATLDCYLLDDNAYVIVSENLKDTGQFFGEIQGAVMERMVVDKLYRRIEIHDFQAVCFVPIPKKPKVKVHNSKLYINRTRPQPCETKINLYVLNNKKVKSGVPAIDCTRPYYAKELPKSNLILVVVNSSCPFNKSVTVLTQPEEVLYRKYWCCKSDRNLTRRNTAECANYNELEDDIINVCGGDATTWTSSKLVIALCMYLWLTLRAVLR